MSEKLNDDAAMSGAILHEVKGLEQLTAEIRRLREVLQCGDAPYQGNPPTAPDPISVMVERIKLINMMHAQGHITEDVRDALLVDTVRGKLAL